MQPIRGITLKILSVCVFVVMAALVKAVRVEIPAGEAMFFRSIFALPVIFAWMVIRGDLRSGLHTKQPLSHFWRGLIGTCAMGLGFTGLGMLPLPEVTAIGYATPIFVVIFAAMFLGEKIRAFRMSAVALGMVGVLIVVSPRLSVGFDDAMPGAAERQMLGAVVVLGASFCAGLAHVYIRKLVLTESTTSIVFWFSVTASVLSLLTLPWGWVWPRPTVLVLLISAGLVGGLGQILLTSSYKFADAGVIAPFDYVSMILALAIGYFIFDEVPTMVMLGGASLTILAGVLIILREGQLGLERSKQRGASQPGGG